MPPPTANYVKAWKPERVFPWLLRLTITSAVAYQLIPWLWTYGPLFRIRDRFLYVDLGLMGIGQAFRIATAVMLVLWFYRLHFALRDHFPQYRLSTWYLSALLFLPFFGAIVIIWKTPRFANLFAHWANRARPQRQLLIRALALYLLWFMMWAATVMGVLSANVYIASFVPLGTVLTAVSAALASDIFGPSAIYVDFVLPLAFLWLLAKTADSLNLLSRR